MTRQPVHLIRGERVYLRASERSDIPNFVRWLNDGETSSFLSMRSPMSVAMEEKWFDGMLERQGRDAYHFVICRIEDDAPLGTIGLFDVNLLNGSAGIGIAIGEKSYWGKGYGTDAMNALLDFGFGQLRLERMWLEVFAFNERAQRSYEKSGFVVEGRGRHAVYVHGRYEDEIHMAILRDEWLALDRKRMWEYADDGEG